VISAATAHDWVTGYAVKGDAVLSGDELIAFLRGVSSPAALSGVGGSFAAVLPMSDRLRVITDRMGSRPVFYARTETGWLAGSEFWALASRLGSLKPSAEAAVQLLAFKYVLGTETMSERILEAPPGTKLDLFHDGRAVEERYWRYRPEPRERSGRKLVAELSEVIDGMAERTIRAGSLMGLDHWGVNLTAGRDSRVIFGSLVRSGVPVTAYTSVVGADARVARELAASVGVAHESVAFWDDLASPWVDRVADPLAATTMAAVAGHPISLSLCSGRGFTSGWVSGQLGGNLPGGLLTSILRISGRGDLSVVEDRVATSHQVVPADDLRSVLRSEWRGLANEPARRMREVVSETDSSRPEALIHQVDLEQRQRRFILRDYLALRELGPTVLWYGDPAWASFWETVPTRWLMGTPLYSRVLTERLFVGKLAPLARIPANGRSLASVRLPRLTLARRELARRALKRIKREAARSPQPHRAGLTDRETELASWLIEPDYFRTDRPRALVESVRSIARATELLGG